MTEDERKGGILAELRTRIIIRRFENGEMLKQDKPYNVTEHLGNVGLNEGLQLLLDMGGLGIYTSSFHSGVARCGVGTCSAAAVATQTGLQSNLAYGAMDASYPTRSGQALGFRTTFSEAQANDLWNEFTVANASGNAAVNLFRAVSVQGSKLSGQSWQLDEIVSIA